MSSQYIIPGLYKALQLEGGGIIAIVGGGGKTALTKALAMTAQAGGHRAAISTTAHILPPGPEFACVGADMDAAKRELQQGHAICAALPDGKGKLISPGQAALDELADLTEWLIIEADGSRGLPLKAPAEWEPALPARWDFVIAVAGLSALGQPLRIVCQRPELAADLLGMDEDAPVSPELVARLLLSPQGQMKGIMERSRFRVLLNQADMNDPAPLLAELWRLSPGLIVAAASLREGRVYGKE